MASMNEAFGQIGAAKIFTSSVSNILGDSQNANQQEIAELQEQLNNTEDKAQRSKLQKKIQRLRRSNNLQSKIEKSTKGATDFLIQIAMFCDMTKKEIITWLADYLVKILPALEISVKAVLLTNLKKMISCSIDPRIPDYMRTEGILINEREIDPRSILESSPYSKFGRYQYYGVFTDDDDTVGEPLHSLARATDMNAFIWYAKNCAKYVSPIIISEYKPELGRDTNISDWFDVPSGTSLYTTTEFKGDDKHWFLPGCTFKQTMDSQTIFLCIAREGEPKNATYTIVPCTNIWTGVNWYKNKENSSWYKSKDNTKWYGNEGNINKSKPLFNLEYSNNYNSSAALPKNNFRLKILPKPFQIACGFIGNLGSNNINMVNLGSKAIKELAGGEVVTTLSEENAAFLGISSLIPHMARFNPDGTYNKGGKYTIYEGNPNSVSSEGYHVISNPLSSDGKLGKIVCYKLMPKGPASSFTSEDIKYVIFDKNTKAFYLSSTEPTEDSPHGTALTPNEASKVLIECYGGKTVYEFNYDYIMSFKLFNAKVIAASIINGLLGLEFPNPFKRNKDEGDITNAALSNTDQLYLNNVVDQMIQNLILQEGSEATEFKDCFYTFSNEQYIAMEEATAQKVINGNLNANNNNIQEIYDILDMYDADSTLHEQTEIITRALTKASEIMESNGSNDNNGSWGSNNRGNYGYGGLNGGSNGSDSGGDFITKAIKYLITEIINSILTPKVIMLIQMNNKLMGNDPLAVNKNYNFTVQDIIGAIQGTLMGMISEVVSAIQAELLRAILKRIGQIMNGYVSKLALEYARKWVDLLKQLLACFKRNSTRMSGYGGGNSGYGYNNGLNGAITNAINSIEGADIDALADELLPNTKPC